MSKKVLSLIISALFVLSIIPFGAAAAEGDRANAPGGTVTSYEELVVALGGDGVNYGDGKITVVNDVILAAPIVITEGNYMIVGEGAVIKADFRDGEIFVVEGEKTSLTLGDPDETQNNNDLVFDGEGSKVARNGSYFRVGKGAMLEIYNSVLIKNSATSLSGGAVYNEGELMMYGGEMNTCRASAMGGAVYNKGTAVFASGKLVDCSANTGGTVYNEGKATFSGAEVTGGRATHGGAVYNASDLQLLSSVIKDCQASRGAAICNSGKTVIKGGAITENKSPTGDGGGVYNTGVLELSGNAVYGNEAENGGNIYNSGRFTAGESFTLSDGKATNKGGNVYNGLSGTCTFNSGSVISGSAKYGGGLYNVGTFNFAGSGFYNNSADVGEGVLNYGKLTLSKTAHCIDNDDIFVVITPDNAHAIKVDASWEYSARPVYVSSGVCIDGVFTYKYSKDDKLLDIAGDKSAAARFELFDKNTGLVLSSDGTLVKAPKEAPKVLIAVIIIVIAFAATVAVMVYTIRSSNRRRLAR